MPHKSVVLARDEVQIGLAENGGDSSQDGCAFHAKNLEALFTEFKANGLQKEFSEFDVETAMESPGTSSMLSHPTASAIGSVNARQIRPCENWTVADCPR